MRILIIDDEFVDSFGMIEFLHEFTGDPPAHDVRGILPEGREEFLLMTREEVWIDLSEEEVLSHVQEADLILLDHNMPGRNGQEMFEWWEESGIRLDEKVVVGISSDSQPYLKHRTRLGFGASLTRILEEFGLP